MPGLVWRELKSPTQHLNEQPTFCGQCRCVDRWQASLSSAHTQARCWGQTDSTGQAHEACQSRKKKSLVWLWWERGRQSGDGRGAGPWGDLAEAP